MRGETCPRTAAPRVKLDAGDPRRRSVRGEACGEARELLRAPRRSGLTESSRLGVDTTFRRRSGLARGLSSVPLRPHTGGDSTSSAKAYSRALGLVRCRCRSGDAAMSSNTECPSPVRRPGLSCGSRNSSRRAIPPSAQSHTGRHARNGGALVPGRGAADRRNQQTGPCSKASAPLCTGGSLSRTGDAALPTMRQSIATRQSIPTRQCGEGGVGCSSAAGGDPPTPFLPGASSPSLQEPCVHFSVFVSDRGHGRSATGSKSSHQAESKP